MFQTLPYTRLSSLPPSPRRYEGLGCSFLVASNESGLNAGQVDVASEANCDSMLVSKGRQSNRSLSPLWQIATGSTEPSAYPTSHPHRQQGCGDHHPCPTTPIGMGMDEAFPALRAGSFPACAESPTARDCCGSGDYGPTLCCVPLRLVASGISNFGCAAALPGLPVSPVNAHHTLMSTTAVTRGPERFTNSCRIESSSTISCQGNFRQRLFAALRLISSFH